MNKKSTGLVLVFFVVVAVVLLNRGTRIAPDAGLVEQSAIRDKFTPPQGLGLPDIEERSLVRENTRLTVDTAGEARAFSFGKVRGHVALENTGLPVAGIAMVLESEAHAPRLAQTDYDGSVWFPDVLQGEWTLRCVSSGDKRILEVEPNELSEAWFQIQGTEGVVRVVDTVGAPIVNARVRVSRLLRKRDVGVMLGMTDTLGEVGVRPVEMAMYVEAAASGYSPSSRRIISVENSAVELVLRRGGCAISGTVTSEKSGEPIQGALVTIGTFDSSRGEVYDGVMYPMASPVKLVTDAEGKFRAEGLGNGSPAIEVKAPGWAAWKKSVQVHPSIEGGNLVVNVAMVPGLVLKGQVVTESEEPVSGVFLTLRSSSGIYRKSVSKADGSYVFIGLPPTAVTIHARDYSGGAQAWEEFDFNDGVTREIVLSNAHTISGRVVDANGRPVHNARVGHWRGAPGGQGNLRMIRRTDSRGKFVVFVNNESAGAIPFAVLYPETSRFPCILKDVEPGSVELELVLEAKYLEPARITARTERVVKLQQVDGAESVVYSSMKSEGGEVVIEPVPPGSYEIHLCRSIGEPIFVGRYSLSAGEQLDLGVLD